MREAIRYRGGYKYQLAEDYATQLGFCPLRDIDIEWVRLDRHGAIWIKRGYAWDGPSGPTIDTKNFMRGSLVHDALYQLIRSGHLMVEEHKDAADIELYRICVEDGMSRVRAEWVYWGVRIGGGYSCRGDGGKTLCEAP